MYEVRLTDIGSPEILLNGLRSLVKLRRCDFGSDLVSLASLWLNAK